jgi:hypothetical protein
LDEDIRKERAQFQAALLGKKTSKLAEAIDELFDTVKQADMNDTLGWLTGGYGVYAGGSGLLAGKYMYDQTMKNRRINKINKALRLRRLMRSQQEPTTLLVADSPDIEAV